MSEVEGVFTDHTNAELQEVIDTYHGDANAIREAILEEQLDAVLGLEAYYLLTGGIIPELAATGYFVSAEGEFLDPETVDFLFTLEVQEVIDFIGSTLGGNIGNYDALLAAWYATEVGQAQYEDDVIQQANDILNENFDEVVEAETAGEDDDGIIDYSEMITAFIESGLLGAATMLIAFQTSARAAAVNLQLNEMTLELGDAMDTAFNDIVDLTEDMQGASEEDMPVLQAELNTKNTGYNSYKDAMTVLANISTTVSEMVAAVNEWNVSINRTEHQMNMSSLSILG